MPRRTKHPTGLDWLPKPHVTKDGENVKAGEPHVVHLNAYTNDRALHGSYESECCGCGFVHIRTIEVFKAPDGDFYANFRAYAFEDTRPKRSKKRTRTRKK